MFALLNAQSDVSQDNASAADIIHKCSYITTDTHQNNEITCSEVRLCPLWVAEK